MTKEQANHRTIFVHGFDSYRYDALQVSPVSDDQSVGPEYAFSTEGTLRDFDLLIETLA
jgi:hypothetical protein